MIYNYLRSSGINQILKYETEQFSNVKEIINDILVKQQELETVIAKNHSILRDNLNIIQNESLKLISQVTNPEVKTNKELESNLITLIESALKEPENSLNEDNNQDYIEDCTKPNFSLLNYLKEHTREIVVVSVAFLIGTFLFNK